MHDLPLVSTIAAGFTAAWVLGLLTQRLRLSPIVGYLLAGVLIGPQTPGFAADVAIAQQLAEVGVILLMFGVGLHFHLKDLLAVRDVAIPGAIGQSLIATLASVLVFAGFGLSFKTGAVLGMAVSVASTVVLMRVLMDADALNSPQGHVAVGWLIVEDIFTVVLLVLIPMIGNGGGEAPASHAAASQAVGGLAFWQTLGLALLKLVVLVAVVLLAGPRVVPWVLAHVARLRSRELFTLTVLVASIAIAVGSYYFFGASMALGAFLAGMVVAQSPVSHQAAADALPLRDAFAVLFFVSVGMLFDPAFLVTRPLMVAATLGIILLVKPLAALTIVALLGHSARTGLTVAVGLAQIGEFSFILSDLAGRNGLMSEAGHSALIAAAIISITLNPLLFRSLPRIEAWLRRRPELWRLLNGRAERRVAAVNQSAAESLEQATPGGARLAIVIGYGPVGRSVHRLLREANLETVIVDMNVDTILALSAEGQTAIYGDASQGGILEQAGARRASHVILTLPHSTERVAVVAAARRLNPQARILVRARYLREREHLEQAGANAAVFEEAEAAVGLARLVLADTGVHRAAADQKIRDLRLQLIQENISNIRTQRVSSVMAPWARVRRLLADADHDTVLAQVSQERFSRWPVVEPRSGRVVGYLLAKDLIARAADADWSRLVRPLKSVSPDATIDAMLNRMQSEGDAIFVVEQDGRPMGLITQEDILEQVVGQIEDEYPHEPGVSLFDALANGAIVLSLAATTREQAVAELAAAIPDGRLPPEVTREQIARTVLQREREIATDLGNGMALPHARCAGLAAPIAVLGRSMRGITYSEARGAASANEHIAAHSDERGPAHSGAPGPAISSGGAEPVRLIFLLVTPEDQPEIQLALLNRIALACREPAAREALLRAETLLDVLKVVEGDRGSEQAG